MILLGVAVADVKWKRTWLVLDEVEEPLFCLVDTGLPAAEGSLPTLGFPLSSRRTGMTSDTGLPSSNVATSSLTPHSSSEMDDRKMEEKDWRRKGLGGGRSGVARERRVERE